MEFLSRRAIMKKNAKVSGRKRPREEDSSVITPPAKVLVPDVTDKAPLEAVPEGTTVPPSVITLPVVPAEGVVDKDPSAQSTSTPERLRIETELDLELSLRQKRAYDINAADALKSTEKEAETIEMSKEIDLTEGGGDMAGYEYRARGDRGKRTAPASAEGRQVADGVSSSGTGTFGFISDPSASGVKVSDSGNQVEVNKSSGIPPANQASTFYDDAEMHGPNVNLHGLEHDIEQRTEGDRPSVPPPSPPLQQNDINPQNPVDSSTPGPPLTLAQLGDRVFAALDELKTGMQQLLLSQATTGTAAQLAQGVVSDLRILMSRNPYSGTLNLTFCGLMVAARLGHLTPFILDDPVVQILLGDHIEDLRHVINSVYSYQNHVFRGPQ